MVRSSMSARRGALCLAALLAGLSAVGATGAAAASNKKAPIVIGYITSETGVLSGQSVHSEWAPEAVFGAVNARGGIDGHRLELKVEDDQSSPSDNQTAAEVLVNNDHVFAVIEESAVAFGAAKFLQQQGVPVFGPPIDGPEWSEDSNMFAVTPPVSGPVGGHFYTYTGTAKILKLLGVTRLAQATYDIPSALTAAQDTFTVGKPMGIGQCFFDKSVPLATFNATVDALTIKHLGCNGVTAPVSTETAVEIAAALKSAGSTAKQLYYNTYNPTVLAQPSAMSSLAGTYSTATVPFSPPTPGAKRMLNALHRYTPFSGNLPELDQIFAYASGEAVLVGLQKASPDLSRAHFMSVLRTVSMFTAGGLLPSPTSFAHFGTAKMFPKSSCGYFVRVTTTGYVNGNGGKPVCGRLVRLS